MLFETKYRGINRETQTLKIQFSGARANEEKQNFMHADVQLSSSNNVYLVLFHFPLSQEPRELRDQQSVWLIALDLAYHETTQSSNPIAIYLAIFIIIKCIVSSF